MLFFILMQIRTIAIIAEGIPEALTRKLIKTADKKGVTIIGPATVSTGDLFLPLSICLDLSDRLCLKDKVYPTTHFVFSHTKCVLVSHFKLMLLSSVVCINTDKSVV